MVGFEVEGVEVLGIVVGIEVDGESDGDPDGVAVGDAVVGYDVLEYGLHLTLIPDTATHSSKSLLTFILNLILKSSYAAISGITETIRTVYHAMFMPHLLYGLAVWGGCGKTNCDKVRRIHRRTLNLTLSHGKTKLLHYDQLYEKTCLGLFHRYAFTDPDGHFHTEIKGLLPIHTLARVMAAIVLLMF